MADKFIYNISNDNTENYLNSLLKLNCLDTYLKEPTNQNSIIVQKVVKPVNKNVNLKLWGLTYKTAS